MGFLTGWVGLMAIAIGVPYSFVLLGANLQTLVGRWFGLNLHWSFWFVLALGIAFALCYLGIRESMNVDLTFLAVEMGICLILAAIVLFRVVNRAGSPQLRSLPRYARERQSHRRNYIGCTELHRL